MMEGLGIYVEGVLFGVVPSLFVGPVLFTLVHASLRDGFRAGALVALGIAVSDVIALVLCALGVGALLTTTWGSLSLGFVGGIILVVFAGVMLFGRPVEVNKGKKGAREGSRHFISGFLINFINPFVFAFWIGALGVVSERHGFAWSTLALFFGGTITTILGTDLLKARLAATLEKRLSGRSVQLGQRISGAFLGCFGIYVLGCAFLSLFQIFQG